MHGRIWSNLQIKGRGCGRIREAVNKCGQNVNGCTCSMDLADLKKCFADSEKRLIGYRKEKRLQMGGGGFCRFAERVGRFKAMAKKMLTLHNHGCLRAGLCIRG